MAHLPSSLTARCAWWLRPALAALTPLAWLAGIVPPLRPHVAALALALVNRGLSFDLRG